MKYFYLSYADEKKYEPYGVAYAPHHTDLFLIPLSGKEITKWSLLELTLKEGEFCDYQANDLGGRLCSEKLKDVINGAISEKDCIQWLETVVRKNGESRKYYYLHFPKNFPILNKDRSIMINDDKVVKPVLSKKLVKDLNIFTLPNTSGVRTFVSKKLKKLLEQNKFTGLDFSKISVV